MTIELPPLSLDDPALYRIYAQGRFSPDWLDMLSGEWTIADTPTNRTEATILVGQVLDQAALLGVLMQLYNMGLPLLSIECLTFDAGSDYRIAKS
ncbi:MAG TPA: hypothetical protein P5526_10835 [Anaerolineae bacterium]|nr:hypothetical protein [Anaerolineae bacterium]MCB0223358.1 hypothetical protein [Anaerolineae bacterium]MCB9108317.1 hypothetical protein [Anaerolineales bacterium]HRV92648.1 hypothetical protein [Anaerolineae bacterium]